MTSKSHQQRRPSSDRLDYLSQTGKVGYTIFRQ